MRATILLALLFLLSFCAVQPIFAQPTSPSEYAQTNLNLGWQTVHIKNDQLYLVQMLPDPDAEPIIRDVIYYVQIPETDENGLVTTRMEERTQQIAEVPKVKTLVSLEDYTFYNLAGEVVEEDRILPETAADSFPVIYRPEGRPIPEIWLPLLNPEILVLHGPQVDNAAADQQPVAPPDVPDTDG
ncbi:MAG: hypothetical protein AAF456_20240 [Planctomycetota bacterium]